MFFIHDSHLANISQLRVDGTITRKANILEELESLYDHCAQSVSVPDSTANCLSDSSLSVMLSDPPHSLVRVPISAPPNFISALHIPNSSIIPSSIATSVNLDQLASTLTATPAAKTLAEHDLALVTALTGAASYLEHLAEIEKEIIEAEGWNFDTAAELIELSKKLGHIPFGGGSNKLHPSAVPSRKGKEREVSSQQEGSSTMDPEEDIVSWLGDFPIGGKSRFWQSSFFLFCSARRPCLSYGTNSSDSNLRYLAGEKSPRIVWPFSDPSMRLPTTSRCEFKGLISESLYGKFCS